MKKISILSIIMVTGLFTNNAKAITHTAQALVFNPLEIIENRQLSFGTILAGSQGGTVTVTEDGVTTTGVTLLGNEGAFPGEIEIHGTPTDDVFSVVQIISTPPTQLVNDSDSSKTMAVSDMQIHGVSTVSELVSATNLYFNPTDVGYSSGDIGVVLDSEGEAVLTTTGKLTVGANQAPGFYSGIWSISVIYTGAIYNTLLQEGFYVN